MHGSMNRIDVAFTSVFLVALLSAPHSLSWGCAYRAGQTLESWVVRQKKQKHQQEQNQKEKQQEEEEISRSANVHSVLAMQRALVEMGDKLPAFVGSRDWIGGTVRNEQTNNTKHIPRTPFCAKCHGDLHPMCRFARTGSVELSLLLGHWHGAMCR